MILDMATKFKIIIMIMIMLVIMMSISMKTIIAIILILRKDHDEHIHIHDHNHDHGQFNHADTNAHPRYEEDYSDLGRDPDLNDMRINPSTYSLYSLRRFDIIITIRDDFLLQNG